MQESNESICGMTLDEMSQAADALSQQTDHDLPAGSGSSYQDFIKIMESGHEKLLNCKSYNKKKRSS